MGARYSIVLPISNQADHLRDAIEDLLRAVEQLGDVEFVLVVNASRDATLAAALDLAAANPQVKVVESPPGWGSAVATGLRHATGEVLCYSNSARTRGSDLVLALRYSSINDQVLVKASRKVRDSRLRRFGSVIYNFEARTLFHLAVWDVNGTPKVFHRPLYERLSFSQGGDLLDVWLLAQCARESIPVLEFPVFDTRRRSGRSTTRYSSAFRMYAGLLALALRRRGEAEVDELASRTSP